MKLQIRKFVTHVEDLLIDGGRAFDPTLRLIAVAAVMTNPWANRGFVQDLRPEILALAPELAGLLVERILELTGSPQAVEAFGKAAVVGTSGELEHAAAFIHTVRFGDVYRDAVAGSSVLSFSNFRTSPNGSIVIPMVHKSDDSLRSHFHTVQFSIGDAPAADELVVALGAATRGRPHHRIGTRAEERAELAALAKRVT
jgi:hypothetical protein